MHRLRLPAKAESLESFRSFVLEQVERLELDPGVIFKIELVLEELLINVVHYAYPNGEGDLEIGCLVEDRRRFCMLIQDWGDPFDPLAREAPDLSVDLSERKIGGLGIHLVREMVDGVNYEREQDKNVLSICFNL